MAADRRSSAVRDVRESTQASLGQGNARVNRDRGDKDVTLRSSKSGRHSSDYRSGGSGGEEAKDHDHLGRDGVRHGEQTEQSHESPMADGGGKRLTTTKDVVVMAEEGRIAELESEIENEQLRRRAQGEGSHELLPVAVTVTVDLSQVDSGIVR
ncbi:hypothetical protein THAOC_18486, partial [Thalassiosira oceanica]